MTLSVDDCLRRAVCSRPPTIQTVYCVLDLHVSILLTFIDAGGWIKSCSLFVSVWWMMEPSHRSEQYSSSAEIVLRLRSVLKICHSFQPPMTQRRNAPAKPATSSATPTRSSPLSSRATRTTPRATSTPSGPRGTRTAIGFQLQLQAPSGQVRHDDSICVSHESRWLFAFQEPSHYVWFCWFCWHWSWPAPDCCGSLTSALGHGQKSSGPRCPGPPEVNLRRR